jgi:hypothetical protein
MIIKVRKAKSDSWTGLKYYDKATTRISVGLDSKTGELKTGLTKEDEIELEKELGYLPGTLARSSEFWREFYIPIGRDGLDLDTAEPMQRLYHKVLSAKKMVAKSLDELKTNSQAQFVMFNEVEEAKSANLSRKDKKNAFAKFAKMTASEMRETLLHYGEDAYNMDEEVVEDLLGTKMESNPTLFLTIVGDPDFGVKAFLQKLASTGILRKKNGQYIYGEVILGTIDKAIEYLKNEKDNQEVIIGLKRQLQDKRNK